MNVYLICGLILVSLLRLLPLQSDIIIPLNLFLVVGLVLYNLGRLSYTFWKDGLSVHSFDKVLKSSIGEKGVEFVVFERMVFKGFLVFCRFIPDSTPFPNLKRLHLPRNVDGLLTTAATFMPLAIISFHYVVEKLIHHNMIFHMGLLAIEIYSLVWVVGIYQLNKIKRQVRSAGH